MDVFLEGEKYLIGIDRLDEIVGYLRANGLIHDILLLALGDHHHGHGGGYRLDCLEGFEATDTWHHLVEKDKVETALTAKVDGIVTIAHRDDLIAFLFQKNDVGTEMFYLVIHPQQGSVFCHIVMFFLINNVSGRNPRRSRKCRTHLATQTLADNQIRQKNRCRRATRLRRLSQEG